MNVAQAQKFHDTIAKLKPKARGGLGSHAFHNAQEIDNGLPKNGLYCNFVRELGDKLEYNEYGDGRVIKRNFDDCTPDLIDASPQKKDKKLSREERKAVKKAAKLEAKRQAKLQEKRKLKAEAKAKVKAEALKLEKLNNSMSEEGANKAKKRKRVEESSLPKNVRTEKESKSPKKVKKSKKSKLEKREEKVNHKNVSLEKQVKEEKKRKKKEKKRK